MFYAISQLKINYNILSNYKKDIEKADKINVVDWAKKIYVINRKLLLLYKELELVVTSQSEHYMITAIFTESKRFNMQLNAVKTKEELLSILNKMIQYAHDCTFNQYGSTKDIDLYNIPNSITKNFYYANGDNTVTYNTSEKFIDNLCNKITVKNDTDRNINIFMTNCNEGEILMNFTHWNKKLKFYATEPDRYNCRHVKEVVPNINVLNESINANTKISNKSFDIVYIQPMISIREIINDTSEKTQLSNIYKYVRENGIIIIAIPSFRIAKNIASNMAKQLKDVNIFSSCDEIYNATRLIYIVGRKSVNKEVDKDTFNNIRNTYDERPPFITDEKFANLTYELPVNEIPIKQFFSSMLTLEQMRDVLDDNPIKNDFVFNQITPKIYEQSKQPLIPFNLGHIGLILTSGCLDGLVDEKNGNYHLIKGRVIKKNYVSSEYNENDTERTETTTMSNKTEIYMLCADGTFKPLL